MDDEEPSPAHLRCLGNLQARFGFMTPPCLSVKRGGLIAAAPVRKENALPVTTGAVTAKQVNH